MIFKTGNMFETTCDCIVNPVNSVSVMGGGLAKIFMEKYPGPCKNWNKIYNPSLLEEPRYYPRMGWFADKDIIMFPSKIHYRNPSELSYIEKSLERTLILIHKHKIKSIAFPAVGSGLGGLNWQDVKEIFEHYEPSFKYLNVEVEVYEPQ